MVKQIPNILTLGRVVLTIIFLIMVLMSPGKYSEGEISFPGFLDIAFILFVIAGLTDMIDGTVARRMGVTSKFGRMMDPLADKILVCGAFICFAIIGRPRLFDFGPVTLAAIHWSVAIIIVVREILVTVIRHLAEAKGIKFPATFSGKIKMFVQSFAIGTVVMKMAHVQADAWGNWFAAITFVLMVIITVVSGLRATSRSCLKESVSCTNSI